METEKNNSDCLDAVITWVNGNNEKKKKEINDYKKIYNISKSPNAINSRFSDSGEIKYCVLSILKFAPFIKRIFIVTDGERPALEQELSEYYPQRIADIIYISHNDIFKGFESYLPLFNSRAIETMLWNIPDISDVFVYFNDDFFLVRQTNYSDFVENNKIVARGHWSLIPVMRLFWYNVVVPKKRRRASFHMGQWNAARCAGFKFRYFVFEHTPYMISKSLVSDFYKKNKDVMLNNIRYKFRSAEQYNPSSLSIHLCLLHNRAVQNGGRALVYMQPYARHKNYIERKVKECEENENIKFMCAQDLSLIDDKGRSELFEWLDKIILPVNNLC